jgi:hypothetical protein
MSAAVAVVNFLPSWKRSHPLCSVPNGKNCGNVRRNNQTFFPMINDHLVFKKKDKFKLYFKMNEQMQRIFISTDLYNE